MTARADAQSHFDRTALPPVLEYFERERVRLIGRGERWRSALCPFHCDDRPSLRIDVVSGGFVCMACKERGGDVLDFHRKRHGLSFEQAARDLGAWR